eukprot:2378137-Lingulodinium_polyedra.AAC.1
MLGHACSLCRAVSTQAGCVATPRAYPCVAKPATRSRHTGRAAQQETARRCGFRTKTRQSRRANRRAASPGPT